MNFSDIFDDTIIPTELEFYLTKMNTVGGICMHLHFLKDFKAYIHVSTYIFFLNLLLLFKSCIAQLDVMDDSITSI